MNLITSFKSTPFVGLHIQEIKVACVGEKRWEATVKFPTEVRPEPYGSFSTRIEAANFVLEKAEALNAESIKAFKEWISQARASLNSD